LGISIDITARKQAELDAQRGRAELSHLSRVALMGEMSASIAHELNQPLSGISVTPRLDGALSIVGTLIFAKFANCLVTSFQMVAVPVT
jgi:signal transduction histidine kinase